MGIHLAIVGPRTFYGAWKDSKRSYLANLKLERQDRQLIIKLLDYAINTFNYISEENIVIDAIVSGGAWGTDTIAEEYAEQIDVYPMVIKANWKAEGKKAGFLRNSIIEKRSDAAIVLWDGESRGTKDTLTKFIEAGKPVICAVANIDQPDVIHLSIINESKWKKLKDKKEKSYGKRKTRRVRRYNR